MRARGQTAGIMRPARDGAVRRSNSIDFGVAKQERGKGISVTELQRRLFIQSMLMAPLAPAASARFGSAREARRTFARLLKISVEYPSVNAEVRSSSTEDGLIVEDVAWPAADSQTVPAFLIRPA